MLTAYTLDAQDRITSVDPGWDAFALANDGEGACATRVVGGRLADAITGDPVRMFMTAVLMRVRASGQTEQVPYRCDSERVKRFYTMTLKPLDGNAVRVEHFLDREEQGSAAIRIRPARAGETAVLRCSICCRVKEGGQWLDPLDGTTDRELRVVHTVCDDCKAAPFRRRRAETRTIHLPRNPV